MLTARHERVVETVSHSFGLMTDNPRDVINGQYPEFSLAIFAEDVIFVKVGVRSGPVDVAVEMHDEPAVYDDENWEDAVEGDLHYDLPDGLSVFQSLTHGFPLSQWDGSVRSAPRWSSTIGSVCRSWCRARTGTAPDGGATPVRRCGPALPRRGRSGPGPDGRCAGPPGSDPPPRGGAGRHRG